MPNNLLIFILIITNAGGEGKTTLTLLIRALFDLAGVASYALDADQGNYALKNQYDEDVYTDVLPWNVGPAAADKIVSTADFKPVSMDAGANMLVAFSPIADLVPELQRRFTEAGYRTVVLFPLSPNKSGGAGGINMLADKIKDYEKFVVLNHRDQSEKFGDVRLDLPRLNVRHLASGLQAYLSDRKRSLSEVILDPEPGFRKAAAHIGEWLRSFALDPVVRNLLTTEICDSAISRIPAAPRTIQFALNKMDDVTDARITDFESRSLIVQLLDKHLWTAAGLRAAADELEGIRN